MFDTQFVINLTFEGMAVSTNIANFHCFDVLVRKNLSIVEVAAGSSFRRFDATVVFPFVFTVSDDELLLELKQLAIPVTTATIVSKQLW